MSTDSSYSTAAALTGSIRIGGNTYANRSWLKSEGAAWDSMSKTWVIKLTKGNKATQELLYGIASKGMRWERA